MKKITLSLLFIFLTNSFVFADDITVNSPKETIVNDTFTANIIINTSGVLGAEFELIFDNSILIAEELSPGPFIESCFPGVIKDDMNNPAGKVEFMFGCKEAPFGKGTLVEIKFRAISSGKSELSLSGVSISDASGKPVANIKIKNGEVNVKGNDIHEEQPESKNAEEVIETPTTFPAEQPASEEENDGVNIIEQQVETPMNESINQSLEQKEKKLNEGDKNNITITTDVSENASKTQDMPIKNESITEKLTESNQTPAPENQKTPQPEDTSAHWLWMIVILVLILSIIYIIYNILKE